MPTIASAKCSLLIFYLDFLLRIFISEPANPILLSGVRKKYSVDECGAKNSSLSISSKAHDEPLTKGSEKFYLSSARRVLCPGIPDQSRGGFEVE